MKNCFLWLGCAALAVAQDLPPLDLSGVREQHVMIPMRDGVRLSAYLYLPEGEGKWPAVFEQRYADISGASTRKNAAELARHGFAVAMVNFRGSQKSEGQYVGYRALAWGEKKDGYDTCAWLVDQQWCDGRIGTMGLSYAAHTQAALASLSPPGLACMILDSGGFSNNRPASCLTAWLASGPRATSTSCGERPAIHWRRMGGSWLA